MDFITREGLRIKVGRVDRRLLDNIDVPEPAPPLKQVETWGGLVESLPVFDDPAYQRAMQRWRADVWRANLDVIVAALGFVIPKDSGLDALREIGMGNGTQADYLRFNVCAIEQTQLVELVYYNSTVTQRGIVEAEARFGYEWRDKPLSAWAVGYTPGKRGGLAVDYRAAFRSGLTWDEFCAQSGPDQSALVAFWMLEDRLGWLLNNENHT